MTPEERAEIAKRFGVRSQDVEMLLAASTGRTRGRWGRWAVLLVLSAGMVWASVRSELAAFLARAGAPQPGELVPRQLPYRGYLERDGVPVSTPQSFTFKLEYGDGGTAWTEPPQALPVSGGHFEVALGDSPTNSIPAAVFSDPFVLLSVSVGGLPLVGKQRLLTVPYAARSLDSWRAEDAARSVNATNAVTATTAGRVILESDAGVRTTVDGLYVGATAPTSGDITAMGGALTGYRAAKRLCEQVGGSSTAHMCTGIEITRSVTLGMTPTTGWVSAGSSSGTMYLANVPSTDCAGFTSSNSAVGGTVWFGSHLAGNTCNSAGYGILCCD